MVAMKKINLYVDEQVWRNFRSACIQHGQSASQVIERLMREQLERWKDEKERENNG